MVVQAGRRGSGGGSKDGPIGATPEAGEGAEVEGGGEQRPLGLDVRKAAQEEASGGLLLLEDAEGRPGKVVRRR